MSASEGLSTYRLYGYWRSSASWRVRAAFAYKGIPYEHIAVHLRKNEHVEDPHRGRSPAAAVPLLEIDTGIHRLYFSQSLAIIAYLDESFPQPALLPADPTQRMRAREIAEAVNAGVHPLQNLSVLRYVRHTLATDERAWAGYWIEKGLLSLEQLAAQSAGRYAVGDALSIADLCLTPQLYNARRFAVDLEPFPTLRRVEAACMELPAFQTSHPDAQPDAERDVLACVGVCVLLHVCEAVSTEATQHGMCEMLSRSSSAIGLT